MKMKNNKIMLLIITSVWILHGGCATILQPKIEEKVQITPPIPYEKAFGYVIEAGDDVGFEPAKYPKPNKEKGVVVLMAKREMGERIVKALFFTTFWTHFVLEIRIDREGEVAKGVDLKVTQAGGAAVERKEAENLKKAYLDALRKRWR